MNIQEVSLDEFQVLSQTYSLWSNVRDVLGQEKPLKVKKHIEKGARKARKPHRHSFKDNESHKELHLRKQISKMAHLTPSHQIDFLVYLLKELREPNIALFDRIVAKLGEKVCLEIFEDTRSRLAKGELKRVDGHDRTYGGAFLTLLKERISKDDQNYIWEEQKRLQSKKRRDIRKKIEKIKRS